MAATLGVRGPSDPQKSGGHYTSDLAVGQFAKQYPGVHIKTTKRTWNFILVSKAFIMFYLCQKWFNSFLFEWLASQNMSIFGCPSEAPDVLGHELKQPAVRTWNPHSAQIPRCTTTSHPRRWPLVRCTKKTSEKLDEDRFNGHRSYMNILYLLILSQIFIIKSTDVMYILLLHHIP